MNIPLEFSFKLLENNEYLFYATKHKLIEEYIINWYSTSLERIMVEHYLVHDVEDILRSKKWIIVDVYE